MPITCGTCAQCALYLPREAHAPHSSKNSCIHMKKAGKGASTGSREVLQLH